MSHLGTPGNRNYGEVKLRQMICVMATLEKYSIKENFYLRDKYFCTSEYMKRMWENMGENFFNFLIWWTEPERRDVLENTAQKNVKIKGVDPGIDQSKPPFFNSVKYQVFMIFTMSIANLL